MSVKLRSLLLLTLAAVCTGVFSVCFMKAQQETAFSLRGKVMRNYEALDAIQNANALLLGAEVTRQTFSATKSKAFFKEYKASVDALNNLLNTINDLGQASPPLARHLRVLTDVWTHQFDPEVGEKRVDPDLPDSVNVESYSRQLAELRECLSLVQSEQRDKLEALKVTWIQVLTDRNNVFVWVIFGFTCLIIATGTIPIYFLPKSKEAALKMSLQLTITHSLARANTVLEAATSVLSRICPFFGFACGAIWLLDDEVNSVQLISTWSAAGLPQADFDKLTHTSRFASAVGFPGTVRSHWNEVTILKNDFPNSAYAVKAGSHTALGFPIFLAGRLVGMIEFYTEESEAPKRDVIDLLSCLVEEMGQSFESLQSRIQLLENSRLASFTVEASQVIAKATDTDSVVRQCTDLIVRQLDAAFARIWIFDKEEEMLVLSASSGLYTDIDGHHGRIPLGQLQIGMIASQRRAHVTHDLSNQPLVDLPHWAAKQGLVSFIGYPLIAEGELIGVVAMYARHKLSKQLVEAFGTVGNGIAVAIKHRKAEEQVIRSENLFRQLAENIREVFFVLKPGPELAYVSPAFDEVWGRPRSELIANPFSFMDSIVEEDRADVLNFHKRAHLPEINPGIEFRIFRPNGLIRWVWLQDFRKFSCTGNWEASYIVVHDITEKKEAETRVSEFYSTVSHELRTPLTSIHGSLRLMEGGLAGGLSEMSSYLVGIATSESGRLIRLINDILDLRKMEAGKLELRLKKTSLPSLIELAVAGVKGMSDEAGITIECADIPDCHVHCDEDRIVQVMQNLVSNAVKFTVDKKPIVVSASLSHNRVKVSVSDQGPGIPEHSLGKLFAKFQQLDSSDRRQKGGTGLGLAISKSIVEQHQGTIGVTSTEGAGSTFWFELAVVEEVAGQAGCRSVWEESAEILRPARMLRTQRLSAIIDNQTCAGAAKILVVDSDSATRELIRHQLSALSGNVIDAADGLSAVRISLTESPDLIILETELIGMSGLQFVQELNKTKLRSTPLLVYSSQELDYEERALLKLGPTKFLTKSRANAQTIVSAVAELLDGSSRKSVKHSRVTRHGMKSYLAGVKNT